MNNQDQKSLRQSVQNYYAGKAEDRCCENRQNKASSCCDGGSSLYSQAIGYASEELANLPDGADLGLGCGNPIAFANVQLGETVLDLGSGGGLDAFIAARMVGADGRVIGVDMTPEMITLAKNNAKKSDYHQVEFRLGLIEYLPVEDECIDLVISNCVVNLSIDKPKVYAEAFRVLKPGGRLVISDPVRVADIPAAVKAGEDAYCGCVAGAASVEEITSWLSEAGFEDIRISPKGASEDVINAWAGNKDLQFQLGKYVVSMLIFAHKPIKK